MFENAKNGLKTQFRAILSPFQPKNTSITLKLTEK
jgi:hypothetical protein